jgi:aminodeoxyfutalosine synthase
VQHHLDYGDLTDIAAKVLAGIRLTRDDGIKLFESSDLLGIGRLANLVRQRKNGNKAFFIVNRHINHTNICVNRCKLCAFGVDSGSPRAYVLSLDEIEERARATAGENISEIHVVGGLNPDLKIDYYREMLARIRSVLPGVINQSFTAVEIDYLARLHDLPVEEVLLALQEAGLDSLPGGGAEIFAPRVRELICPNKISGERWLEVHEAAHKLGMRTNATMLYGHVETIAERVEHLLALRELQNRTGGFLTFIPLAFHPKHTGLEQRVESGATGYDDLKVLAVARLLLDNFDHIKAFWIMTGPKIAQVSLAFGVDDLDGTVVEERIAHDAGADTEQYMSKSTMVDLIRAAGRIPVQRDTLYNTVREVL